MNRDAYAFVAFNARGKSFQSFAINHHLTNSFSNFRSVVQWHLRNMLFQLAQAGFQSFFSFLKSIELCRHFIYYVFGLS